MKITGILLAAGSGSRFGGGKLLHPLPDGTPLGVASLRKLRSALADVLVVVRKGDEELRGLMLREGAAVQVCDDAHLGMARSLICGIRAAADADGWIIALGDMPYLSPATISAVAAVVTGGAGIAMPEYRGERGHPVGFGKRHLKELLELQGDEGARALLKRHPREIETIACDDPGVLRDIDRREDVEGIEDRGLG
ncbi:MAG: nucleotidyltransferase family protein [Pseudomonadota bacterium]